jgi:uncharacterized membrane protein YccF (DUF307 family)
MKMSTVKRLALIIWLFAIGFWLTVGYIIVHFLRKFW